MRKIMLFLLTGALVLAACQTAAGDGNPSAAAVGTTPSAPTEAETPETLPAATVETATDATGSLPPAATPRPQLQATDPSSVQLASGQPQLVEFFAFW